MCDLIGIGDGACDGSGSCVECNSAGQCPDDGNQCTAATCAGGACGTEDVMDGAVCDFVSDEDGICDSGTCVEVPECTSSDDCDDGNVCTAGNCTVDGTCSFTPDDGGSCDVSPGVPGTCGGGSCVGLCDGVDCTSTNQCVGDGSCDDQSGECIPGDNEPEGTTCDQNGGTACDGAGNCVAGGIDYPLQSKDVTVGCTNNVTGDVSILTFTLDVDPGLMSANTAYTASLDGVAAFTESFLDAAQAVVPGGVSFAQLFDLAATVAVRSGAAGGDVLLGPDTSSLSNLCELTDTPCDPANDINGGVDGNSDCVPVGFFNLCQQGFATIPVIDGIPNSAGGCTQAPVGTPVPNCDCSACQALDPTGCRAGDPDVPCTKGDQCALNGFCVNGDLTLELAAETGSYTAGPSGTPTLFGWFDDDQPPGLLSLPAAVFAAPTPPVGLRVSAGGLFVALQCLMGEDSGGPNGIATCLGGPNDGNRCQAPLNNACNDGTDAGLQCDQSSLTACTFDTAASIGCVNSDCGVDAGDPVVCSPPDLASRTPDASLNTFLVP
jgi:hypothetical protein